MVARVIDGKLHAAAVRHELKPRIAAIAARRDHPPGLTAVLVGDHPASLVYVRNKEKACHEVGIAGHVLRLPAGTSQAELLETIHRLNGDHYVDGILVQLPLPTHLHAEEIQAAVAPEKDVDGFGPISLGLLTSGQPRFLPCTPHGIWQLLIREQIPVAGRHVVILGRSLIVGRPAGLILMQKHPQANATVTFAHSQSADLSAIVRSADIVIAAIGQPEFVRGAWLKPGAVVIDVGINRRSDGRLVGDVHYEEATGVAAAITPVPGGVGPMTIAMLLENTVKAAERA